ncbi:peptidoglycan/LPS O-acetylase OafA/YrhL [Sinobacterium caligoides]|uniref:Peptidoglycan/LPS O-acetylase OafA/YrhL n=2 Tax=Sinobacterium caligoides TaxID=933926 RepID=A0A3N2D504_9GAMM|nr:peptidoglycan/LPS O-acetylase OafA/YrhL [Sinobacterium caligoides]
MTFFGTHILKGGFFGVDVFFVLSGYLITGIIRSQMDKGSFSFLDFYWRRAKRIVPALLAMLVVTSVIAYLILLPDDLVTYANSLKSTLYFGSNYFFYGEDSYVSDSSSYKPLLHTWSLAVEWQFYIVFPVIIFFTNRFFKKYLFEILLALTLISLQYANFSVKENPDMAFYLLPARAWELILGGLVTFYDRDQLDKLKYSKFENPLLRSLPILGLSLISYSILFIGDDVSHPSFITLIPVLGTCLFIMFARKGEIATDFLSMKVMVLIGLISYPLYLWHQPIFVFFRFIKQEPFRYHDLLLLICLSTFLSVITYKFIESKYRIKKVSLVKKGGLIAACAACFSFAYAADITNGFPGRLSGIVKSSFSSYKTLEWSKMRDSKNVGVTYSGKKRIKCDSRTVDSACKFGNGDWVTIGDSYAGQLDWGLKERLDKSGQGLISYTRQQCPFVSPDIFIGSRANCVYENIDRLDAISKFKGKKKIIVAAFYEQFYRSKQALKNPIKSASDKIIRGKKLKPSIVWQSYADNINALLDNGHEVYVVYPVPSPGVDVKKLLFSQLIYEKHGLETQYSKGNKAFERANKLSMELDVFLKDRPGLHKIYPRDIFCDENKQCQIINETGGLYNHKGHLSYSGVQMVLDKIISK